jgi:hypothetical protein
MCPGNHVIDRVAICYAAQAPGMISSSSVKTAATATAAAVADLRDSMHVLDAWNDAARRETLRLCHVLFIDASPFDSSYNSSPGSVLRGMLTTQQAPTRDADDLVRVIQMLYQVNFCMQRGS